DAFAGGEAAADGDFAVRRSGDADFAAFGGAGIDDPDEVAAVRGADRVGGNRDARGGRRGAFGFLVAAERDLDAHFGKDARVGFVEADANFDGGLLAVGGGDD